MKNINIYIFIYKTINMNHFKITVTSFVALKFLKYNKIIEIK